jgi:hypothetical protein
MGLLPIVEVESYESSRLIKQGREPAAPEVTPNPINDSIVASSQTLAGTARTRQLIRLALLQSEQTYETD